MHDFGRIPLRGCPQGIFKKDKLDGSPRTPDGSFRRKIRLGTRKLIRIYAAYCLAHEFSKFRHELKLHAPCMLMVTVRIHQQILSDELRNRSHVMAPDEPDASSVDLSTPFRGRGTLLVRHERRGENPTTPRFARQVPYVITKTHCGSRCTRCGPNQYSTS